MAFGEWYRIHDIDSGRRLDCIHRPSCQSERNVESRFFRLYSCGQRQRVHSHSRILSSRRTNQSYQPHRSHNIVNNHTFHVHPCQLKFRKFLAPFARWAYPFIHKCGCTVTRCYTGCQLQWSVYSSFKQKSNSHRLNCSHYHTFLSSSAL